MRFTLTPQIRLIVAFFALVAAFTASTASVNAAPSFSTGIIDVDAFQTGEQLPFQRAADAGARYVKNNVFWDEVVSNADSSERPGSDTDEFVATDPGSSHYNWSVYDRFVRKADSSGLTPILTLTHSPKWARDEDCRETDICSPIPSDYADFAKAAALRYSGNFDPEDGEGVLPRVRHWQAWVEPNLTLFYAPIFKANGAPLSPYRYRGVLNAFYNAVHGVDQSNVVIAAGLAPNAVKDRAIAPLDFTRRALCMKGNYKNPKPNPSCKAQVKADVWAVHPYTTGAPAHLPASPDNMSVGALPRMTKLIKAANRVGNLKSTRGHTRVWATEFSWDSNKPDPGGLSWNEHTRWVAEAMYLMFKAKVDTMIWFGLRDQDRNGLPFSQTFQSGLYLRGNTLENDKPKKVIKAFSNPFYAKLGRDGIRYWGRTPDSKPAQVKIFGRRKGGGGYSRVGTTKANANGIYTGFIRKRGFTKRGAVRSKISGGPTSVAFGLYKTKDRRQPPFG
jgi:hypothetical protein